MTINPGTYLIQPGESTEDYPEYDTGDATFECPARGVPCVVTVEVNLGPVGDDPTIVAITTVKTVGGKATARSSTVAMMTKAAIDLSVVNGGLNESVDGIPGDGAISVKRSPDGVTTVTLTTTQASELIPFTRGG